MSRPARGALRAVLPAFLLAGLSACQWERPPWEAATYHALAGNLAARRGDALGASWRYHLSLEALAPAPERQPAAQTPAGKTPLGKTPARKAAREGALPEAGAGARTAADRARIAYNLSGVYASLGELEPALRQLERSLAPAPGGAGGRRRADEELRFRANFNLGVLLYTLGRYPQAAAACIRALQVKPGSWPAKVNLELCLKKMQAAPPFPRPAGLRPAPALEPRDREALRQIQRKEKTLWQTGESPPGWQQDW